MIQHTVMKSTSRVASVLPAGYCRWWQQPARMMRMYLRDKLTSAVLWTTIAQVYVAMSH